MLQRQEESGLSNQETSSKKITFNSIFEHLEPKLMLQTVLLLKEQVGYASVPTTS